MELATQPMAQWTGVEGRPLLISGPCSAESEAQVMETARRLSALRVDYFRAGIWKARTRPSNFEGIGDAALAWLACAGRTYGMRTATEVATARHVEAALEHGIDLLWIGARTTVNPFSVQEIATALRGTSVPVLIKNPTSPDLGLWIGALERVHAAGVRALGAIHRGFTVAGETRFRNTPMWERAIELRRMLPHLPIIADPSHISGRRDLIAEVAQAAMDLGLDGLMVESHPNPDQAWSDAAQQVTPERLGEIVSRLTIPRVRSTAFDYTVRIVALRDQIDHVDRELVDLLAQRMRIVDQIGRCKRENNVTALQVDRWRALLEDRIHRAAELGLTADYVRALYEVIHAESVRRQSELMHQPELPMLGSVASRQTA
jgi:chorismate mutase